MMLKDLLAVFPDDMLVNVTQATISEPVRSTALLLSKMLNDYALNANVIRVQASHEANIPVIDVQIEDTFTIPSVKTTW